MWEYDIIDSKLNTEYKIGYKTSVSAHKVAEKLNTEYGAERYYVRQVLVSE